VQEQHRPVRPVAVPALAAAGGLWSIWLGPVTPLPTVLVVYLLYGIAVGTINPPITNSAVCGTPCHRAE
jgi:hypothetical protein